MFYAIVPLNSREYPRLLSGYVYSPPVRLYRIGRPMFFDTDPVAVVGTRDPTEPGLSVASAVGRLLAERGVPLVTGLSRGVDIYAAHGAASHGGWVVGVVPALYVGGRLYDGILNILKVSDNVTVVAEHYSVSEKEVANVLAARNRIIAGMSRSVIIPETRYRQSGWGTSYMVKYGIEAGRKVVVVKPQTDDEEVVRGFRYFVERGAVVASTPEEAVELALA
ncbi:MAG: hypothetical protein F9Y92_06255 [Thermoplasmatales archaeon]|nr:hypothetical protein [Thermoplasmatales archaeon]